MARHHHRWTPREHLVFRQLKNPIEIQLHLDTVKYNIDSMTRSPRGVIAARRAHCFDGAIFAAAAIEYHGGKPLLIDLRANHDDDDHILAIFERNGLFGSIGQSNYTGGRFRDPVFRTIRELVMSYFCTYFNLAGRKTLREYSGIFDLTKVRDIDWRFTDEDLSPLGDRIDSIRHYPCLPPKSERELSIADMRTFKAETLFLDKKGAFKVKGSLL
ncbi:MAG: hypothetical protein RL417_995 [Pseudomonadota bacterium]|jgi:hypothetical protein